MSKAESGKAAGAAAVGKRVERGEVAKPERDEAVPAPATVSTPSHPTDDALPLKARIAELERVHALSETAEQQQLRRIAELERDLEHALSQHGLERVERQREHEKLATDHKALLDENAMLRDSLGRAEEPAVDTDQLEDMGDSPAAILMEALMADGRPFETAMYVAKGKGLLWTSDPERGKRFRWGRDFMREWDRLRAEYPNEPLVRALRPAVHSFAR